MSETSDVIPPLPKEETPAMVERVDFSRGRSSRWVMSVFQQLGITFSRQEWAALNAKEGKNYPYPFADIVPISTALNEKDA